jgi:subtilisin family serine protease
MFSIKHKIWGVMGTGENDDLVRAIVYAADNGAHVISMSIGGGETVEEEAAINYAYGKGVVLVAAAGNENTSKKSYPAGYANVIAVAATAEDDSKASYSNCGDWIDVAAPGGRGNRDFNPATEILSTLPKTGTISDPSGYLSMAGTSMACPYVAGLAGLIRSNNPRLTNAEVRGIIRNSADDLGAPGFDTDFGYGRVNVRRAIELSSVSVPLYRFCSTVSNAHFYTISESEKNKLIQNYANVWTYEGVAFYVYD